MKHIVYYADGAIEETSWADQHVREGLARYATPKEIEHYERCLREDDRRLESAQIEREFEPREFEADWKESYT